MNPVVRFWLVVTNFQSPVSDTCHGGLKNWPGSSSGTGRRVLSQQLQPSCSQNFYELSAVTRLDGRCPILNEITHICCFRPKWSSDSEPHSIWVSKALCKPQQILLTGRTSIISGDCDPLTGKWVVYTLEFSFWSGKERKRKNYFTFHILGKLLMLNINLWKHSMNMFCSFCIWKFVATNVTQSGDQVSRDIAWLESGKEEEKEKASLTFNDLNISATTNIQHHHPHNWHQLLVSIIIQLASSWGWVPMPKLPKYF